MAGMPSSKIAPIRLAERYLKGVLRLTGFDLVRPQPGLFDFMVSRQIDVVLDIGANTGQFGARLRRLGYQGEIVSFEPSAADHAVLAATAARDGRWRTHPVALGAETGRAVLNVSEASVFSSFCALTAAATAFDPRASVAHREAVEMRRLDDLPLAEGTRPLLKIDTQGFERQVLDGASQMLKRVHGVLLELPIVQLYQNTWRLAEAIDYMAGAGFVIAQVTPVNYRREDPVSLLEIDCLFRRA